MKTLYLVRHAKASHDNEWLTDWERPLTPTGSSRAERIAKKLRKKKVKPSKILSSHAFRALNTAVIFAVNLDYPVSSIELSSNLYESASGIIDVLKKQADSLASIMIFGHNPSMSKLLDKLSKKKNKELSTSAVACIQFEMDKWGNIDKIAGKIMFTETDK